MVFPTLGSGNQAACVMVAVTDINNPYVPVSGPQTVTCTNWSSNVYMDVWIFELDCVVTPTANNNDGLGTTALSTGNKVASGNTYMMAAFSAISPGFMNDTLTLPTGGFVFQSDKYNNWSAPPIDAGGAGAYLDLVGPIQGNTYNVGLTAANNSIWVGVILDFG